MVITYKIIIPGKASSKGMPAAALDNQATIQTTATTMVERPRLFSGRLWADSGSEGASWAVAPAAAAFGWLAPPNPPPVRVAPVSPAPASPALAAPAPAAPAASA